MNPLSAKKRALVPPPESQRLRRPLCLARHSRRLLRAQTSLANQVTHSLVRQRRLVRQPRKLVLVMEVHLLLALVGRMHKVLLGRLHPADPQPVLRHSELLQLLQLLPVVPQQVLLSSVVLMERQRLGAVPFLSHVYFRATTWRGLTTWFPPYRRQPDDGHSLLVEVPWTRPRLRRAPACRHSHRTASTITPNSKARWITPSFKRIL